MDLLKHWEKAGTAFHGVWLKETSGEGRLSGRGRFEFVFVTFPQRVWLGGSTGLGQKTWSVKTLRRADGPFCSRPTVLFPAPLLMTGHAIMSP